MAYLEHRSALYYGELTAGVIATGSKFSPGIVTPTITSFLMFTFYMETQAVCLTQVSTMPAIFLTLVSLTLEVNNHGNIRLPTL
jgi:hypothetical protein